VIETLEKQMNSMELQLVDAHNCVLYNDLQTKKKRESFVWSLMRKLRDP